MLVLLAKQSIFVLCTQAAQIMFTHQNHQMRTLHAIQQILETKRKIRRRKRLLLGLRKDRKKRNTWVANGRTDQWWNNMLGDDIPDQCWKKNFRMTKEAFLKLADEIRDLVGRAKNRWGFFIAQGRFKAGEHSNCHLHLFRTSQLLRKLVND